MMVNKYAKIAKIIIKRISTGINFLNQQNKKKQWGNSIVFKQGNNFLKMKGVENIKQVCVNNNSKFLI